MAGIAPSGDLSQTSGPNAPDWNTAQRIGFRFVCAYLVLYNLPFPLGVIPGTSFASDAYTRFLTSLVPWVGKHVFHTTITVTQETGSGDRTFDFVQLACVFVLAVAVALIWTLVSAVRRRPPGSMSRIHDALRTYVRYVLGFTLISYGMFKIIQTQFPFPHLARLVETYGESSPMGLLWTFMGYSKPYNFFAGLAEAGGGLLLFFRRTTTLGALVAAGVMLNIAMLNFCYDVPVKQYSVNLLLMAVFLLAPDLRRLANLLLLNRPTAPVNLAPPWRGRRWLAAAAMVLQTLFIGYALYSTTKQSLDAEKQYGDKASKPVLYGIYEVEEFNRNGQALPPMITDSTRWRRVIFQSGGMFVKTMDDAQQFYRAEYDPARRTVALTDPRNQGNKNVLSYSRPDMNHLVIDGPFQKDSLSVKLRKIDESKFLLLNRGYHWINEFPFNR